MILDQYPSRTRIHNEFCCDYCDTWYGIAICHYKFRKAFLAQGHSLSELKYKAKFYPFGPIFAMVLCIIVIAGQNYAAFMGDQINWQGILVSYIGLPLFLALYIGYKLIKKTKPIKAEEADISGFNESKQ